MIMRLKSRIRRFLSRRDGKLEEGPPPLSVNVSIEVPHEVYGSTNCDWPIIPDLMNRGKSIVYSVGVGANITWDAALIEHFDCEVWGFDPTPKTLGWARKQTFPERFHFVPVGLSHKDGVLHFAPPKQENHISFSPLDAQSDNAVECKVERLSTIMKRLGHDRVDVLKMDIEGGEYGVIEDILASDIRPMQLMAEFHHDMYAYTQKDTHRALMALYDAGYRRFYKSRSGREQGFVYVREAPAVAATQASADEQDLDRGVIYFAFGKPALDEAKLSLKSLKVSNPSIPAAIFTDLPEQAVDFDIVHKFNDSELHDIEYYFRSTNRLPSLKVRFLHRSPFKRTIHLDCDTYVKGSLNEFFDELESNDFILTNMPEIEQAVVEGSERPVHQSLKSLTRPSSFSCAVFGYNRSPQTEELLHTWWTQFVEKTAGPMRDKGNWGNTGGVNEQGILHQMLADGSFGRAGVKRSVLPNIKYNAGMTMWPRLKAEGLWDDCRILHSHKIKQAIGKVGLEGLPELEELQKFA